ncbi:tol-pal system-associated acyl-CoA thioesterase [Bacterioplanoides sp. SCSIO 12839]|uniref:tol-pal system-associated acyl-CoA thioesterase n=1 Tax=Bacterioplanoides sp. SCSIO 12839 TaxID=2829569 RepID=UPI002103457D|nr:tol-pal system-associated acyl-CoA thioesterase [Bacterioplanoides sp. SCSIO 12839]UTW49377.1 tol-pal system-associated acyl-CoA thioesterase [Bacterioplanoides sp. SCSIO 12839]
MSEFRWPVRVYYEDTDAGGIVYYANYLKFFERARTEWLRQLGFNQELLRQQGILFVVREVNAKYKQPARLDDELQVSVAVEKMGKASFNIVQTVYRVSSEEEQTLVSGSVSIACIDDKGKPRIIPADILSAV